MGVDGKRGVGVEAFYADLQLAIIAV
jgi:hypothetical protein